MDAINQMVLYRVHKMRGVIVFYGHHTIETIVDEGGHT
jgi:hypothetical protein